MKTINKEMYQALTNAIIDEFYGWGQTENEIMFESIEYILGIKDIEDVEYNATLRIVNKVLEEWDNM